MPSNMLELGQILLINSADKIKLSATCTASFQLPQSISSLNEADAFKALTSGQIWTSRGVGCSLDIKVFSDGKPLHDSEASAFLGSLGQRLCDAKLWPQLLLSPGLEVHTIPAFEPYGPNISIALRHGQARTTTKAKSKGWILDQTDVSPPNDVLRAELERIQVRLEFLTLDVSEQAEPRIEEVHDDFDLLLDQVLTKPKAEHILQLESAVRGIGILPLYFTTNFGRFRPIAPKLDVIHIKNMPNESAFERSNDKFHSPAGSIVKTTVSKVNGKFPKEVVDILRTWLESHALNPYPTDFEKQELMMQTGMKRSEEQLSAAMSYYRQKLPAMSSLPEEEMLLSIDPANESLLEEDHIDLLSEYNEDTPSLSSSASTFSATQPPMTEVSSHSTSWTEETYQEPNASIYHSVAGKLMDVALQNLIGGHHAKSQLPAGIQIEKPVPETSLSQLVPTMFNPGYRELIAHNSRFIPTISLALSVSLCKNAQTPSLKSKLQQLSTLPISPLHPNVNSTETLDPPQLLSRIIQTRIFSMMQQTLYNPLATRKLWKQTKNDEISPESQQDEDFNPDLLDTEHPKNNWDEMLANFTSDDEFDDLLYEDEDDEDEHDEHEFDDLLDESEREKLAIERETNEMLFGDGDGNVDGEEDDDFLLSGGESDCENMLL